MKSNSYFTQITSISKRKEIALRLKAKGLSPRVIRISMDFPEVTDYLLDEHSFYNQEKTSNLPKDQKDYCILAWAAYHFIVPLSGEEPGWLNKFINKINWLSVLEAISKEGVPFFPADERLWRRVSRSINLKDDPEGYKKQMKKLPLKIRYDMYHALPWDDESLKELTGVHPGLIRKKIIAIHALDNLAEDKFKTKKNMCHFIGLALIDRWEDALTYINTFELKEEEGEYIFHVLYILFLKAREIFKEQMKILSAKTIFEFIEFVHNPGSKTPSFFPPPINYPTDFFKGNHLKHELCSLFPGLMKNATLPEDLLFFYQSYIVWSLTAPVITERRLHKDFFRWYCDFEINREHTNSGFKKIRETFPGVYEKYNYQNIMTGLFLPLLVNERDMVVSAIKEKKIPGKVQILDDISFYPLQLSIKEYLNKSIDFSLLLDLYEVDPIFVDNKCGAYFCTVLDKQEDEKISVVNRYILFLKELKQKCNHSLYYYTRDLIHSIEKRLPPPGEEPIPSSHGAGLLRKHFPVQEDWITIFRTGSYIGNNHSILIEIAKKEYRDLDYKSKLILAATGDPGLPSLIYKNLSDSWVYAAVILIYRLTRNPRLTALKHWLLLYKYLIMVKYEHEGLINCPPGLPASAPHYTFSETFMGFYGSLLPREELISRMMYSSVFKTKKGSNLDNTFKKALFDIQHIDKKTTYYTISFIPYSLTFPWHEDMAAGLRRIYFKVKIMKHRFTRRMDIRRLFWFLVVFFTREETFTFFEDLITDEDKQTVLTEAARRLDDLRKQASLAGKNKKAEEEVLDDMEPAFILLCLFESPIKGIKKLLLAFRVLNQCTVPGDLDLNERRKSQNSADANRIWKQLPRLLHTFFCRMNYLKEPGKLRKKLAAFLVDRLKPIKKQDGRIKEPSPLWQEACIQAAAALGVNPRGKLHCVLEKVIETTQYEEVKEAAAKAVVKMKKLPKSSKGGSHKRYALNAWWFLRYAHRLSSGKNIEHDAALIIKRKEIRE